jgi:deazaflavin-dependent oxidoreductase (nitroreductase family)
MLGATDASAQKFPRLRRVDPSADRGRLFRAYTRLLGTRPAGWLSKAFLWRLHPVLMRLTGGRIRLGMGLPTALLTTTGARTGQVRRNAVIYFHDGDRVTLVPSKLGEPRNPAWFHNLVAHPDVMLNGAPFRAEVVVDEGERRRLWALADRVFPAYALYRSRAERAGRTIPIVQLVPRP